MADPHWTRLLTCESLLAFTHYNRDTRKQEWDGKWHKVNRLLIFLDSHAVVNLRWCGTVVDDSNIIAVRNKDEKKRSLIAFIDMDRAHHIPQDVRKKLTRKEKL